MVGGCGESMASVCMRMWRVGGVCLWESWVHVWEHSEYGVLIRNASWLPRALFPCCDTGVPCCFLLVS